MLQQLETTLKFNKDLINSTNIAGALSDKDQAAIAREVVEGYETDEASRSAWRRRNEAGMKLALQVQEAKNFPWPNCANVVFPLVTIAAMQFHSEAAPAILGNRDIVAYTVRGDSDILAIQRAERVGKHMSWQIFEEDLPWLDDHDRLLLNLAIVGTAFVKSYYSERYRCPVAEFVPAVDYVTDYGARCIEDTERGTHLVPLSRNRIWERCAQGIYLDVREDAWFRRPAALPLLAGAERDVRQGVMPSQSDYSTRFTALEQHVHFDLDGDGYAEPYIAVVAKEPCRLLRLVARVASDRDVIRGKGDKLFRIIPEQYFERYTFFPSADNAFYGEGFGKLLGPLNEAVSTGINQLLDNGTVQNSFGGFLGRGTKIRGGVYTMAPWEWKRVDSSGDDLRKNIVPFPERSAPTVMFQLLSLLIDYTNRIAGTTDPMVGENPGQNTPASTFQGMQEQGRKIYRTIFQRVWRSMRGEFQQRYRLNGEMLRSAKSFGPEKSNQFIKPEDYTDDPGRIAPTADPDQPSVVMRVQQASAVATRAMTTPGYDRAEVEKLLLRALGVENITKLYPGPDKVPPLPNPHLQVEQFKAQIAKMKIDHEKWEFIQQLQLDKARLQADIEKIKAEIAQIIASMGAEQAGLQITAFEKVIGGMTDYHNMLNDRIKTLTDSMKGSEDGDKTKPPEQGGMGKLAGPAGDQGLSGDAAPMGGQPDGAMGGGELPGGGPQPDAGGQPFGAGDGQTSPGP